MISNKVESFVDEHEAFAASRVSQYVFVPTKDIYFNTLDQHADTLEGDIKPPLVLVGNEGSGKSALLANWVSKRREHKHRDEFLFQHFVGCTTQSLELSHTLFRLETALKDFFQLREMKVPDTEVELRWSLNRFLEAASKKHFPARIVIIIDGIHRLKAEGTPDGTMYWLPTELPPCVRFIVSTVEYERNSRGKKENPQHLTYVELCRRQCPILKIEPLGVATRHSVINAFCSLHPEDVEITESQQFKIVTAQSSAQPMYLRTLLQALRLATTLTKVNSDDLLDQFLACGTAHELIDKNLNICCQSQDILFNEDENIVVRVDELGDNVLPELLGKMLTVVYVSRSGLTEVEIWGLIKMVTQTDPTKEQIEKLMSILKDYTMVVNNMYSFSHEIYREVVYTKFITSRSALVKWHNVLARFFGQLPPCDRKLVALPYHLEKAGSWSKVKNCLTDIDMFQLWWTPKFKNDFIKFWSSLTQQMLNQNEETKDDNIKFAVNTAISNPNSGANSTIVGNGSNGSIEADLSVVRNRPSYDVVDEYVKSLDEFRNIKHPSDEIVAGIILEIGDFLLEFATLGHEQNADVPALIHPKVLSEDLKAVGVPYIEIDEDGRSSLVYPEILHALCNKQKTDIDGSSADAPTKAIEDVPVCTNYFYHRWMWIQFPYIALGNCDVRYMEGINQKLQDMTTADSAINGNGSKSTKNILSNSMHTLRHSTSADSTRLKKNNLLSASMNSLPPGSNDSSASKSWDPKTFKLPEIKFNRKAARSIPRVLRDDHLSDDGKGGNSKVAQRMVALQDSIQNYREEYDFLVQMKAILTRRLQEFKDNLIDLKRTAIGCTQFDDDLQSAVKRDQEATVKNENVKLYNKNLSELSLMCDRYPANVPALITELTNKIELDKLIIAEIKKRLWEQKFERQRYHITFHHMKSLIKEGVEMHNKLLEYRYSLRKDLTQQAIEDEKLLTQKNSNSLNKSATSVANNSKVDLSNKKLSESVASASVSSKQTKVVRGLSSSTKPSNIISNENAAAEIASAPLTWEDKWSLISSKTGIMEPEAFFQRMNNASTLEKQIHVIKKTSESRLEQLKKEVVQVESELEEVRYEASFAGVQSSKEHQKQLAEKQQKLRHVKEKTESMEQLEQKIVSGLAHISDILFIPKSEEDAPVLNLVRDIEAVLDTLINEREKQLQQQQGGGSNNSNTLIPSLISESVHNAANSNTNSNNTNNNRSPELDFAIARHESPQVRLPKRLPSRPVVEKESLERIESIDEDEQEEEDGTWNRSYVKSASLKNLKSEVKRQTKIGSENGGKLNKSPSKSLGI